jgi:predicted PurR-regulated permease PerM
MLPGIETSQKIYWHGNCLTENTMATTARRTESQRAILALSVSVVVLIIGFVLFWARAIFIPIALAIFLSFILSPLVDRLEKYLFGRVPAVIAVVALSLCLAGGMGLLVGSQLVRLVDSLPDHEQNIKAKVATVKGWFSGGERSSRLVKLFDELSMLVVGPPPAENGAIVVEQKDKPWFSQAETVLNPAMEFAGLAAFSFILSVFMLIKREDLRNRFIRLIGNGRWTTTTKAVDEASRRISRYLLMQLLLNAAFGIVATIGLFLLGVDYAIVWGFFAFVMRYVPYIGTWIGLLPPTLFTLAVSTGWWEPILVLALFIGLETLCNNIFEPRLYGSSLGLSEVALLVAAGVWSLLWGPIGLILSGPMTTCLLVLGKYVPGFQSLNVLLGDQPALEPKFAFYQRLAARDQDEATEIIEEASKAKTIEETIDDVMMPTLTLARNDLLEGDLTEGDVKEMLFMLNEIVDEVIDPLTNKAPVGEDVRVKLLGIPARDQIDHMAVEFLAASLDASRWEVEVAPVTSLASEILQKIEDTKPPMVVIGAVSPGGISHTRYLCKRIRAKFPDLKVVVGRWNATETTPPNQLPEDISLTEPTLASTRQLIQTWRTVYSTRSDNPVATESKGNFGTVSATVSNVSEQPTYTGASHG